MCGIIGVHIKHAGTKKLNRNLKNIFENQKNRGVAGAGFSYVRGTEEFGIKRFFHPNEMFNTIKTDNKFVTGDAWLLHHRVPTCTSNKPEFNHPLASDDGFISIIHNGMVFNKEDLFDKYEKEINTVENKSTKRYTDSEIIRVILEKNLRHLKRPSNANSVKKAITKLAEEVRGAFAIAFTIKGSNKIWLFKNTKPLLVYPDKKGNTYFSSEFPDKLGAFENAEIIEMVEGEMGVITDKGYKNIGFLDADLKTRMSNWGYSKTKSTYKDYSGFSTVTTYPLSRTKYKSSTEKIINYPSNFPLFNSDNLLDKTMGSYENKFNSLMKRNNNKWSGSIMSTVNAYFGDDADVISKGLDASQTHPLIMNAIMTSTAQSFNIFEQAEKDSAVNRKLMAKISLLWQKNVLNSFKRILDENFLLFQMSNYSFARAETVQKIVEYNLDEMQVSKEERNAISEEIEAQYALECRSLNPRFKQLELAYFGTALTKRQRTQKIKDLHELMGGVCEQTDCDEMDSSRDEYCESKNSAYTEDEIDSLSAPERYLTEEEEELAGYTPRNFPMITTRDQSLALDKKRMNERLTESLMGVKNKQSQEEKDALAEILDQHQNQQMFGRKNMY